MASEDSGNDAPSLELPSLRPRGWKRRSRATEQPAEPAAPVPPAAPAEPREPVAPPEPREPVAPPEPREPVALAGPNRPWAPRRQPRLPTLPALAGLAAAVATGALVGLVVVALTWGSLQGCDLVRGTRTCGGGAGLLLLVTIMVVSVLLGGALLRLWGVSDPGSTSFLAVALLAVLALLFLIDVLSSWWMVLVIPVVAAGTFALSHWVTTAFVEPSGG